MNGFEGSYGGDATRIDDHTRLECPVCWYRYDPAAGDPLGQIPPGTPFARLPDHWRCPECDGAKAAFLVCAEGA